MDKNYWQNYYESHFAQEKPSLFAEFVLDEIHANRDLSANLIELGCGNGRDAIFFAKNGLKVLAIEQCENVVEILRARFGGANLAFQCADFTALNDAKTPFSCVYSRFTLHAIRASEEARLLQWIRRNLAQNGILAIEARGLKNALYRRGVAVEGEENAFIYDGHYRRFIDFEKFCADLGADFEIKFAKEARGFAPFEDDDDIFFRVIARFKNAAQEREREREKIRARNNLTR